MVTAMVQVRAHEWCLTDCAIECDEAGPDSPIEVLPFDSLLLVQIIYEAAYVE